MGGFGMYFCILLSRDLNEYFCENPVKREEIKSLCDIHVLKNIYKRH